MAGKDEPADARDSDDPSLDPRSWLPARMPNDSAGPDKATDQSDLSFDPKSWAKPAEPASKPTPSRRKIFIGAGVASLLLAGGGAIVASRFRFGAANGASDPSSGFTYDTPDVSGLAGLEARLINYGVSASDARSAGMALLPLMGPNPGLLHLSIRLGDVGTSHVALTWLEARRAADGAGFQLDRQDGRWRAALLAPVLTPRLVCHLRCQINGNGLYASAIGDLDEGLMREFADALAFDFDIGADVREGDQFEAVHEERRDARGNLVGRPHLVFAFLSAGGKDVSVYRFTPPGATLGWFDERGRSAKRAFMRTPLDGARVTSLFGLRVHPVFHKALIHNGIDFGCPIGTHIFAAADGLVDYAGSANGFGVLLKLRHAGGMETWYGHLSGFPASIKPGQAVTQGEVVAFSGNFGVSTGPHLHYETHINGQPVDPKTFLDAESALPGNEGQALEGQALEAFFAFKDEIDRTRRAQA